VHTFALVNDADRPMSIHSTLKKALARAKVLVGRTRYIEVREVRLIGPSMRIDPRTHTKMRPRLVGRIVRKYGIKP
jgi:polyribonucleotide nucleotidyltransferase